jgi:hypothetical protein
MRPNPFAKASVDPVRAAHARDVMRRGQAAGFAALLDVLGDPEMFKAGDRLVLSRAAAALGVGKQRVLRMIEELRAAIGDDE